MSLPPLVRRQLCHHGSCRWRSSCFLAAISAAPQPAGRRGPSLPPPWVHRCPETSLPRGGSNRAKLGSAAQSNGGGLCLWCCADGKAENVSGKSHAMCQRLKQAEMWIVIPGAPMGTVFRSQNTVRTVLMSALMFLLPKCSFSASSSLVQGNVPQGPSPCCQTAPLRHPVQLLEWGEKEGQKNYKKFQKRRRGEDLETFHPVQGKKQQKLSPLWKFKLKQPGHVDEILVLIGDSCVYQCCCDPLGQECQRAFALAEELGHLSQQGPNAALLQDGTSGVPHAS